MLLLYAVMFGIVAGLASGGRLAGLGSARFRLWPVALAGLAFQAVLFSSPVAESVGRLGPSLYVLSSVLVLMALVVNLRQPGLWLVMVGALLNLTAIVANGGQMPASPDAIAALTGSPILQTAGFANSVPMSSAAFPLLGDIFVLPRPIPFANVFSIGDVLIGLGGAWFVIRSMHRHDSAAAQPGSSKVTRASHG